MSVKKIGCCKKCGNDKLITRQEANHVGLYCAKCGQWHKWLPKDEINLYESEIRKNLTIKEPCKEIHENAKAHGWWENPPYKFEKEFVLKALELLRTLEEVEERVRKETAKEILTSLKKDISQCYGDYALEVVDGYIESYGVEIEE